MLYTNPRFVYCQTVILYLIISFTLIIPSAGAIEVPVDSNGLTCPEFLRNSERCKEAWDDFESEAKTNEANATEFDHDGNPSEVIGIKKFGERQKVTKAWEFNTSQDALNQNSNSLRKKPYPKFVNPRGISQLTWIDINNDGVLEAFGRAFDPKYIERIRLPGKAELGEILFDDMAIFSRDTSLGESDIRGWVEIIKIHNHACVHLRKVLPGDFNNDGFMDLFATCHGFDNKPFPGSLNLLLTNNGTGNFSSEAVTPRGYWHGATSHDFNDDGWLDVLLLDSSNGQAKFLLLLNDSQGGFATSSKNPVSLGWGKAPHYISLVAEDVNSDGSFDLLLGGHEEYGARTTILLNSGDNSFSLRDSVALPKVNDYPIIWDFHVENDSIFVLRQTGSFHKLNKKRGTAIQKFKLSDGSSELVYESSCDPKRDSVCNPTIDWLRVFQDENDMRWLISVDPLFNKSVMVPLS